MATDQDYNLSPDALAAMTPPAGDLSTRLNQAAEDEGAAYRGRVASEQPQVPEPPSFGWGGIEPITQPSPQAQPPYDYTAANLQSGRNLSRQSFVGSYNKQALAEPWVSTLNAFASAMAGRPVSPYNASAANYRQLTPSEEAEKYRSQQSEYAGLAAGIATPELASAAKLARFAPGPNQFNIFLPAKDFQKAEAVRMESEGIHPNTILKQTGAFRDVDGRWMREISDAESRVTPEAQQYLKDYESASGPAAEIFEHPELYKQAPGLKKYEMDLEKQPEFITPEHPDYFPGFQRKAEMMEQMGRSPKDIFEQSYMRRTPTGEWEQRYYPLGWHYGEDKVIRATGANPEDLRKTLLHESQHAVDKGMGRPNYGASDDRIYQELAQLPREQVIARAQASLASGSPWAPKMADFENNWEGYLRQLASDEYMRNAAEVRARNVETRRNMSPAERLQTHPFKTMEVPPENQIIGYEPYSASRSQPVAPEPRSLDQLGYYSQALEAAKALPQTKGTPEQMLAQLKKAGVKDAEIKATNLPQFLQGKKSVTRDELVNHLEQNRIGLNEVRYGSRDEYVQKDKELSARIRQLGEEQTQLIAENAGAPSVEHLNRLQALRDEIRSLRNAQIENLQRMPQSPAWQEYSLDPQNPSYRETVLHLPDNQQAAYDAYRNYETELRNKYNKFHGLDFESPGTPEEMNRLSQLAEENFRAGRETFISGHFSEPNITGHLMTSMVKDANGRNVFNVDQIQSDWGQKLREGGVRDEARIQKLRDELEQAKKRTTEATLQEQQGANNLVRKAYAEESRLLAELRTAEASPTGHPLVNTTDQWTNTTLRHAIKQAVESGADAISIPHGDTVLSYNPSEKPSGMRKFYNEIVPKNLGKLLKKLDPQAPAPEYHEKLETPNRGLANRGHLTVENPEKFGFTVFPLTDKIKQSVLKEGQPLFKRGGVVRLAKDGGSISSETNELLSKLKRENGGFASRNFQERPLNEVFESMMDEHPDMVPPSGSFIPKGGLQPDDPNFGNFRALGEAFHYTVPPGARESTNIEDRRYTHPSMPTSAFGMYNGPGMMGGVLDVRPAPPSPTAGIQGMSGTQSGPSATREPWTANMASAISPFTTQIVSRLPLRDGGGITDRTRQLLRKLKNCA